MATSILERHEAERLAIRMVDYELPTTVVELGTGLPRQRVKDLYKEIHGRNPRPGMMQETPAICRTGLLGIEVSLLVDVYRALLHLDGRTDQNALDPEYLLYAYDWYLEYRRAAELRPNARPLTPTQAYVVLRDWRAHLLSTFQCRGCAFHSYYHISTDPYCYPCVSDRSASRYGR